MRQRRRHRRVPFSGGVALGREEGGPDGPARGGPAGRRTDLGWGAVLRGVARLLAPPLASAGLLTLAFPPAEVSWLAYFALVPLAVSALRARTARDAFVAAWVGGVVFFGVNLYWIQPITTAGYLALMPYLGLYWAVWAALVRWAGQRRWVPLALAAPAVWVALEWVRGWLLTGLPWLFVGHTQYENLVLIQTADALGAYGPSALCLATTGLVTAALVRPLFRPPLPCGTGGKGSADAGAEGSRAAAPPGGRPSLRPSGLFLAEMLLVAAAWAATVGYGLYRLAEAPPPDGPGLVVASVQTNVPQEIKLKARLEQIERLEERLMREQVDLTTAAVARARAEGRRVDLVVWPETMVPGILNREFLEAEVDRLIDDASLRAVFRYLQNRSRRYWLAVREAARSAGAPVLCGAHAVDLEGAYRLPAGGFMTRGPRRNTAFLISPASRPYRADHRYAKVHLVPFGEYVPFKESWPWLHRMLQAFTPYDYDHSLTPGSPDQPPFRLAVEGRGEVRFQVAICYEGAMAYLVRRMVRPRTGPGGTGRPAEKAVDFLVNISNDGWFRGSWELDQHLTLYVFRAVENRVPIVRSVNTGISAAIQSTGRITSVVERDGRRREVAGFLVDRLVLDPRLAPYTVHGDLFAYGCLAATGGLVAAALGRRLGRGGPGRSRPAPEGKEPRR